MLSSVRFQGSGKPTPIVPVTAIGFSIAMLSGRSPNPLPKKRAGVIVEKSTAPTRAAPVPPTLTFTPVDNMNSWGASV